MLYEYLIKNYKETEPIFFSDIPLMDKPKPEISRELRILCEEGKICKYDKGIYYIPKKTVLKNPIGPSADVVASYKYISRRGRVDGYYAGNSLANRFGISTQVPRKPEIVSNYMAAKIKEITIGKMVYVVRRPVVEVTKENYLVLQLLEMIKIVNDYMDGTYEEAAEKIKDYIVANDIKKCDIDKYIGLFPLVVYKNYYEMRIENVFA